MINQRILNIGYTTGVQELLDLKNEYKKLELSLLKVNKVQLAIFEVIDKKLQRLNQQIKSHEDAIDPRGKCWMMSNKLEIVREMINDDNHDLYRLQDMRDKLISCVIVYKCNNNSCKHVKCQESRDMDVVISEIKKRIVKFEKEGLRLRSAIVRLNISYDKK